MTPGTSIPSSLKDAIRAGKLIPFAGAGVSMAVLGRGGKPLFPSWKSLLEDAATALFNDGQKDDAAAVRNRIAGDNLLTAAKYAEEGLAERWPRFLLGQFDKQFNEVTGGLDLAKALWELGGNLIVTSNYDNVLKWASGDIDAKTVGLESPALLAALFEPNNLTRRTIWHIHGHRHGLELR